MTDGGGEGMGGLSDFIHHTPQIEQGHIGGALTLSDHPGLMMSKIDFLVVFEFGLALAGACEQQFLEALGGFAFLGIGMYSRRGEQGIEAFLAIVP